jgi:hypothetical protein
MAKQTFTTGQVLTAAQMTSLQQTAMSGGAASAKTASYTLVAADAGSAISMSNASATTITVNTALFAAGDTVHITNLGAGVCTITAGTATVNSSASLALQQYESGFLDFTSTSAAIFVKGAGAAASGGKVVQIVTATNSTQAANSTTTFADTGLTATITPTSVSNQVLVFVNQNGIQKTGANANNSLDLRLVRGATTISNIAQQSLYTGTNVDLLGSTLSTVYLDSPATTSATTYKTQFANNNASSQVYVQRSSVPVSTIVLMEVTP